MILPIGDVNPTERTPYVNYVLLATNVAVFLLFGVADGRHYERTVLEYGITPAHLQPLDILTSLFLHANVLHLAGNMLFLWICGDNVEDRYGHLGYLGIYLGAGLAAAIAHIANDPSSDIPCIGASGAIAGVLGSYVVLFPQAKIKLLILFFIPPSVVFVRSMWAIGIWFVEQFWMGSMESLSAGGMEGVAYWAHVGGFVLGAAGTFGLTQMGGLGGKAKGRPSPRPGEEEDRRERGWNFEDRRFRW